MGFNIAFQLMQDAPLPAETQTALADHYPATIAARPQLDRAVWSQLLRTAARNDPEVMRSLSVRRLDADQLREVVSAPRQRTSIIALTLRFNADRVDDDTVRLIRRPGPAVAKAITECEQVSDDLRWQIAREVDILMAAELLWSWTSLDRPDSRAVELFRTPSLSRRKRRGSFAAGVFELSPGTAAEVLSKPELIAESWLVVIAGSHRLDPESALAISHRVAQMPDLDSSRIARLALVANPRVPDEIAEKAAGDDHSANSLLLHRRSSRGRTCIETEISDLGNVALLNWAANRAIPSHFRSEGRPWLAPAIIEAPAFAQLASWKQAQLRSAASGPGVPPSVAERYRERGEAVAGQPPEITEPDSSPESPGLELRCGQYGFLPPSARAEIASLAAMRLGEDPAVWMALAVVGDGFTGTLADLCDLAVAVGRSS